MEPMVNFIHGQIQDWEDVAADEGLEIPVDDLAPRIKMGREIWIVQAFQTLRQRGHHVRLSGRLDPNAINVAHYDDIKPNPGLARVFLVSVRADRDPAFLSDFEIVQNQASIWSRKDVFIPHWPQPGLIPRDPTRGGRLENVVYMGKRDNLSEPFKSKAFAQELRKLGLRFRIIDTCWWDYEKADVVLAVRGGPGFYLSIKPAAKLVNAWLAGCPAILSPEAAYAELRKSELDYLEATRLEDVLAALTRLREDPNLFSRMVENGRTRARNFVRAAVTDQWEDFLWGPGADEFNRWRASKAGSLYQARYNLRLARRRLWGQWAIGERKHPLKEALGVLRRASVLPRSVLKT